MQSFIIISPDDSLALEKANKLCLEQEVNTLDIMVISKDSIVKKRDSAQTKSIGIDVIKEFQKWVNLKPFKGKKKAVILKNAELLTIEAQNALLKTLEEPPNDTIIILISNPQHFLLPTILSRCKIITLSQTHIVPEEKKEEISQLLKNNLKISDSLKIAENLSKNRNEAIKFLEYVTILGHEELHNKLTLNKDISCTQISYLIKILSKTEETHFLLQTTNINLRLALEIFFLNFVF